jgi:Purple acid Phosphatase, N-terminal domain
MACKLSTSEVEPMNKLLLQVAIAAAFGGLIFPDSTNAQTYPPYLPSNILPPAKRSQHPEIVQGPALEFARDDFAIIRWTTTNPGGTDDHFAVIHYGTDPTKLIHTAKSPIRLNREHPQTIFRARVGSLKPRTTYYYTVTSMGSDGVSDGETSPIEQFTTPGPGEPTLLSEGPDKQGR